MSDLKAMVEEAKLNLDGQWFVRGNRSRLWIALNSLPDGSAGGIAEKIPKEVWPILERVVELERALLAQQAEYEAELSALKPSSDMVCVPREPTEQMINAGGEELRDAGAYGELEILKADALVCYRAMLAAAAIRSLSPDAGGN